MNTVEYLDINTMTDEDLDLIKQEVWQWYNAHLGNYCCLMFDKGTDEVWLDVYTESNWGEYPDDNIVNLDAYIGLKTGYTFIDCNCAEIKDFAKKVKQTEWDGRIY